MRSILKHTAPYLLAAVLAAPLLIAGCAAQGRSYDAGHGDYHTWNNGETTYYNNWEKETHRDHAEFKDRNADDQKEYWNWRHSHN
jgi:hypothetical protein